MNKYFFPINTDNIGDYFRNAIISPAKYLQDRSDDIQNKYNSYLFLSSQNIIGSENCSLEIVLTDEEINAYLLNISSNCWLLAKPLPITRIKQIIFENEDLAHHCLTAIELNTAFIPHKLIKIASFSRCLDNDWDLSSMNRIELIDWQDRLNQFNHLLGGLAMMRLASFEYMNFSQNYIAMLSLYNEFIADQLRDAKKEIKPNLFKGDYYEIANKYIDNKVNDDLLNEIVRIEKQVLIKDKITKRINIDSLEKASYIYAILRNYKANDYDDGKDNIDTLIISRFNSLKIEKSEEVAFYYGYNRGYSAFTKAYKDIEYKFRLDSRLDYYVIESIFQKKINKLSSKSGEFPFLNWCPNKDNEINGIKFNKNSNKYVILDTVVIGKKKEKVGSIKYAKESFQWFSDSVKEIIIQTFNGNSLINSLTQLWDQSIKKISEDLEFEFEERLSAEKLSFNQDLVRIKDVNSSKDEKLKEQDLLLKQLHTDLDSARVLIDEKTLQISKLIETSFGAEIALKEKSDILNMLQSHTEIRNYNLHGHSQQSGKITDDLDNLKEIIKEKDEQITTLKAQIDEKTSKKKETAKNGKKSTTTNKSTNNVGIPTASSLDFPNEKNDLNIETSSNKTDN